MVIPNDIPGDVRPREIILKPQGKNKHAISGFFDNEGADVVARLIVTFCTKANQWVFFRYSDLRHTGKQSDPPETDEDLICSGFEWLLDNKCIAHVNGKGAFYNVKQEFIRHCSKFVVTKK
jgi:hypothetical protein